MALCCCVLSSSIPVSFVAVSLPRCPRPLLSRAPILPPPSSSFPSPACRPPGSCGRDLHIFGEDYRLFGRFRKHWQWRKGWSFRSPHSNRRKVSADAAESVIAKKRQVVEHIVLLKAKSDLSDDDEKDMLDSLYTSQYHMSGILAISLGRIADPNDDGCSHGVYMRFQRKEDLAKFYQNSLYRKVLEGHVLPHCHDLICLDYESEVEDDILPLFRRGEAFDYGAEFLLLMSVYDDALAEDVEDAFCALITLTEAFSSLIVQSTQGSNFSTNDGEYTHGAVIRFPSSEALEEFRGSSEYADVLRCYSSPWMYLLVQNHSSSCYPYKSLADLHEEWKQQQQWERNRPALMVGITNSDSRSAVKFYWETTEVRTPFRREASNGGKANKPAVIYSIHIESDSDHIGLHLHNITDDGSTLDTFERAN